MTKPAGAAARRPGQAAAAAAPAVAIGMQLCPVSTNELAGPDGGAGRRYEGRADLPELGDELQLEIDELFPIAETLAMLRFAEVAERATSASPTPAAGSSRATSTPRKRSSASALLAHVPIAALIRRVLDERPSHRAPYSSLLARSWRTS